MRDYLGLEFNELKDTLPFEFDLESIIDDWVILSFYEYILIIILYFIGKGNISYCSVIYYLQQNLVKKK